MRSICRLSSMKGCIFSFRKASSGPIIGCLLDRVDQVPVSPARRKEAISTACDRLSQGNVVVVFPEGILSHGNDLHQGKTGAANLALESGAPIVPVGFYVPDEHARMIEQDRESGDRAAAAVRRPLYCPDRRTMAFRYVALSRT